MSCFTSSTIGKKIIVAVTGLILVGFVTVHMLGNLQIFAGPEKINDYAVFLKSEAAVLWGMRLLLLFSVLLHIIYTIQLTRLNRQSRPVAYVQKVPLKSTTASRTMIWGGVFLLFFIVFHLLHYTVGAVHPRFSHTDIYRNVIIGFSSWPVSLFYILGMIALGLHLYHGVFSVFQTLGLSHPRYTQWRRPLALAFALVIPAGYISIPVAVLLGVLR